MIQKQNLSIRGMSIHKIYHYYVDNELVINRKYQRKLVWTLDEKVSFIESIRKGYPIPLILLAEVKLRGKIAYEVIDGLQRLDAIISFLEGSYKVDGHYFDTQSLAGLQNGGESLPLPNKNFILDQKACIAINEYELPVSTFRLNIHDTSSIDDIFLRINTRGKTLTDQEVRQAAALHPFAHLVRRISSEIRGDTSSSDTLYLGQMKQISISRQELNYGINSRDVPWVKQKILRESLLRESQDEEMVASIVAYMLLGVDAKLEKGALDRYYDPSGSDGRQINEQIQAQGMGQIEQQFLAIYDEVNHLLEAAGYDEFSRWIFDTRVPRTVNRYYETLFLALHRLLIEEGWNIDDDHYVTLASRLQGLGATDNEVFRSIETTWNHDTREDGIQWIEALMRGLKLNGNVNFSARSTNLPPYFTGKTKIENILKQVRTGQTPCEFKVNCYPLRLMDKYNDEIIRDISKALTAIANCGPRTVGSVLIGLSDQPEDVRAYEDAYGIKATQYDRFYITGINREAHKYHGTILDYYNKIKNSINARGIAPESIKHQIVKEMGLYRYGDRFIIILRVEAPDDEPCEYEGRMYDYQGAIVREASARDIWTRF